MPHDHVHKSGECCGGDILPSGPIGEGRSFQVSGLDCAEEVSILNRVVGPLVGGAEHLAFDVINAKMVVLNTAVNATDRDIIQVVAATGMKATIWDSATAEKDAAAHLARQKRFTMLSGLFWALGFGYHIVERGAFGAVQIFSGHGDTAMPLAEMGSFLLAVVFGVWLVAPKAWASARHLSPDMNLLMIVAVAGAIGIGEYFEAATVAMFFALSLALESWSVGRARNAVAALLNLAPPTARVVTDTGERDVPAEAVSVGQIFIVRGGDRIPLDGNVVDGVSDVDQAPITGESVPVTKEKDDEVFAGTINGSGTLQVKATKPASDTVLSRIIRMVGSAQSRRAEVEQWVTKFARIYTPAVMVLAVSIFLVPPMLFGGLWGDWFYNALVLLVIACPCALVISTPVSIVAGLASSARAGVLIKGGAFVEAPAGLQALALDKTGTLTKGQPEVVEVFAVKGLSDTVLNETVLKAAASLEVRSSHPLARAILDKAKQCGLDVIAAQDTQTVPGRGVKGMLNGSNVWLGSDRYARELGFIVPAAFSASNGTLVVVGDNAGILGAIALRDAIRPDAKDVIDRLKAQGVAKIVMLTGDNKASANAVAQQVGIDDVQAELLPEDKVAAIEALVARYGSVAMVGDGVNDAPAMARAHFAIAMGAIGSDAAIETADIALMSDDLSKLPWLIGHSRRTLGIIRQNIAFSLLVKAVFVAMTALGYATMWGAIAADVGVSLLVVGNALRLLRADAA
ncbi:heavy metal translocating P-type ATPase [Cochlodiniinecator piscidefendens]|uniref:heavy metal translocating P-type ATPase n=1 Tax=Cochlodiniinecator piscidefendens TaxID=2715756 RepID=UPI001409F466|nr:cation-translocating P-type ATPase [Cochlodiniinecator piscidefendens]